MEELTKKNIKNVIGSMTIGVIIFYDFKKLSLKNEMKTYGPTYFQLSSANGGQFLSFFGC